MILNPGTRDVFGAFQKTLVKHLHAYNNGY